MCSHMYELMGAIESAEIFMTVTQVFQFVMHTANNPTLEVGMAWG